MRTAVCNELFGAIPFSAQCALAARHGFQGIELAPYALAEDPLSIRASRGREIRRTIEEAGLACAGLHWLLRAPAGLHLTTPDVTLRRQSWQVLHHLVELSRDVGAPVMVLGSGRQRNAQGISHAEALRNLQEGLRYCLRESESQRTKMLLSGEE